MDLSPLRASSQYRKLFFGGAISFLGSMVTYVAIPFQVKELTDSFTAVGLVGLLQLVPLILAGLWGGAIADAMDKRKVVLICEALSLLFSLVLVANSLLPDPQLWVVYLMAMMFATADALQRPSAEAITPLVLEHDQLPAGAALNMSRMTAGAIIGPAIGGTILATWGTSWAYGLDAATYVISLGFYLALRHIPKAPDSARASVKRIGQGLAYAWSRKDLLGTYLIDFAAMTLAFPYALFPFVAEALDAEWALGWLYAAGAVGGLIAATTSGWVHRVHRHGRGLVIAAVCWGIAIGFFGLTSNIWWALGLLAIAGGADMISGIFRMSMWNQTVPDELRGRMAGLELLSFTTGPQLGQIRSGLMAQAVSLRFSIASGGFLAAGAAALIAAFLPTMWRYDVRTSEHAIAQREARAADS
jgi:MFS family permease